jgi:hypothetical protein
MKEVCSEPGATREPSARSDFLARMARKYIWWRTVNESLSLPRHILVQVMNIGIWEDILEMRSLFSNEELAGVLANAACGDFVFSPYE